MATSRGYSDVLKERGFVYLLAAQALAVFDDNTFKQLLVLFVTASVTSLATRNLYISLGTALYVLPYIVFPRTRARWRITSPSAASSFS